MKHNLLLALLLFGLLAAFTAAQAEEQKKVYKYTDENGVTHYAETKLNDNYEEADLPALSIVPSTPVKRTSSSSDVSDKPDANPSEVQSFSIISPVNEQNLWGTGGKLTAEVRPLTPAQQAIHQVQFIIDGKKNKPADASSQVFDGIYRGEHTVQALLVNKFNKKVVKKSQTVTFFIHQNSKK
ncbi:hypothetical protein MNBD_GAMMA02-1464 [hydrothermal vent metagenome]|uniref:DUF4124 domain-containing protein n=1 Tax=hydrothermal vent metagenome TaxID=652676 RepID=A0A3B0VXH0_9ZZZZ